MANAIPVRIYNAPGKKESLYIYVPSKLATDSAFPFRPEEFRGGLIMRIDGDRLVIERAKRPIERGKRGKAP